MISYGRDVLLAVVLLLALCFPAATTELGARLEILPSAFLPGVTTSIQLTCRPPPPPESIAQVVSIEVFKQHEQQLTSDPVASYVTAHFPVTEIQGVKLGASVSGSYNSSQPEAAFLVVTLPQPTEAANGVYSCVVYTLDYSGLLHDYHALSALVSLSKNESVPAFYHVLLKELRCDLDTLTSDLNTVQRSHAAVIDTDNEAAKKLSTIVGDHDKITGFANDINAHFNVINQANSSLHSQLNNLRDLTPATPVSFHAVLTSNYITPSIGKNVVFNYLMQHTDRSYSTSTGCFTAPANGTYFFRASLACDAVHTFASLQVNGQAVSSLHAYDDYNYAQATASAVVELVSGDAVCVVKKTGSNIYGTYNHNNHGSYFMGMLLW